MTSRGSQGAYRGNTALIYKAATYGFRGPQSWVPMVKRRHGGLFRPQQPGSSVSSLSEDMGVMPRSTQESFLKGGTGQRSLGPHFLSDSELVYMCAHTCTHMPHHSPTASQVLTYVPSFQVLLCGYLQLQVYM